MIFHICKVLDNIQTTFISYHIAINFHCKHFFILQTRLMLYCSHIFNLQNSSGTIHWPTIHSYTYLLRYKPAVLPTDTRFMLNFRINSLIISYFKDEACTFDKISQSICRMLSFRKFSLEETFFFVFCLNAQRFDE